MQHYLFPNEGGGGADAHDFDTDIFLAMDPVTGIKLHCKRLQRNDPAMTWMTTPRLSNPNIFFVLGQSLVGNTHCLELLVENLVLTRVAAQALAKGIQESKLIRLVIQNSIEERLTEQDHDDGEGRIRQILFQGLQASTTLVELTIQSVPIDHLKFLGDAITDNSTEWSDESTFLMRPPGIRKLCLDRLILNKAKAAKHLAKALKHANTLDCIHVRGQFREVLDQQHPSGRLLQILQEGIQSNPIVKELRIDGVPIEQLDGWRTVMSVMPALHTLTLCDFHDPRGVEQYSQLFSDALLLPQRRQHIQTVQLFDGMFGHDAIARLAHDIRDHATLTTLKLQSIHLDDVGFALLVDGGWRQHRSNIQNVSLHDNDIGPNSVPLLLQCITTDLPDLEWLDLSSNAFGYEGLKAFALELHHLPPRLTFLDVGDCANYREFDDNPAGRRTAEALTVAGSQTGLALLQGMQRNVYIEKLLLENNEFSEEIQYDIQFYVSLNAAGRRLLSMNHGMASTVWCHILARGASKFPDYEASILYYFLSEQPTLVPSRDESSRRRREQRENATKHSGSSIFSGCYIL